MILRHYCSKQLLLFCLAMSGVLAVSATLATADKIRVQGLAYNGTIMGLERGGLQFRTKGGTTKVFRLEDVRIEIADKYPQIGPIEKGFRAAGRLKGKEALAQYAQSASAYSKMAKQNVPAWMKMLARARLVICYGETGKFRLAVKTFIALARSNAGLASKLPLPRPDARQASENREALKLIDRELKSKPNASYATNLRLLRINILLQQGKPKQVLEAVRGLLKTGSKKQKQWATAKEIETLVKLKKYKEASTKWKGAVKTLPATYNAKLAYWGGRAMYGKGEYLPAAMSMMRVPVLYASKNRSLSAEALYWSAQALKKAKAPNEEITALYTEAVEKYPGTDGAAKAKKALGR